LPVDFVVLADVVEVLVGLWVLVVAGFFADVSSVELELAPAAVTQASIPSVISARSLAPRNCDKVLKGENLFFQKLPAPPRKRKSPAELWYRHHP
jgi:hypothetical protein